MGPLTLSCPHCGAALALGAMACFRCGRMVDADGKGGTTGGGALPTELQTLAKAGLLENQWRLIRPIGQGKTGIVWEAQDVALDRRVAIKILHESLGSSPSQVNRFEREARVLAMLDHPNLTPVLGSGRFEGRPFTVMRLLSGRTLAELMHQRGGKLSLSEVSFCVLPVCDALQALHDAKVVHRDLKPSNVFVDDESRVTLLDLGQAFESGSDLTRTGELVGAAEYLSPEQISGRAVDGKSDVYALGCLMHELFTGRPPFTGDLAEVLVAHATAPRPSAEGLPPGVGAVVVKMLAVAPEARPGLAEVRAVLSPHAPAALQLPPMVLPERERRRGSHGVEREPDTTPVDPPEALTKPMPALVDETTRAMPALRDDSTSVVALPLALREPQTREAPPRPLEDESTVQGQALSTRPFPALVREQVTRPTAKPLTRGVMLAMAVVAGLVAFVVIASMAQPPEPVPPPVRVDAPKVAVQVNVEPPAPNAPPGPPPEAVSTPVPPPPLPHIEERKVTVNAAPPTDTPPKRGRTPNRSAVPKGAVRIITTVGLDEITCRLWIDGALVGPTPYVSGLLRKGEHVLRAECPGWPPEELIWPFPSPEKQKVGVLVELVIGGVNLGADRPMQEERSPAEDRVCKGGGVGCEP